MEYSILYERIEDSSFPAGYFYAFVPVLDLVTHGEGIEGAKAAAIDLIRLWIEERQANNEAVPRENEAFFSKVAIEDALLSQ